MLSKSAEMVNLGDNNTPTHMFSQTPTTSASSIRDDELLVHQEVLQSNETFQSINTIWMTVIQLCLLLVQFVMSCLFVTVFDEDRLPIFSASLIIYIQAGLWLLFFLIDVLLHFHHMAFRRRGYLYFYRNTRNLRRASFIIVCVVTTVLLVLLRLIHDLGIDIDNVDSSFRPDIYLVVVVGLQMISSSSCVICYAVKVGKFNRRKPQPDILEDEIMSTFLQAQNSEEIGLRGSHFQEDLIEKQADMIRYLQQHNANLARKLLKYTTASSDSVTLQFRSD